MVAASTATSPVQDFFESGSPNHTGRGGADGLGQVSCERSREPADTCKLLEALGQGGNQRGGSGDGCRGRSLVHEPGGRGAISREDGVALILILKRVRLGALASKCLLRQHHQKYTFLSKPPRNTFWPILRDFVLTWSSVKYLIQARSRNASAFRCSPPPCC